MPAVVDAAGSELHLLLQGGVLRSGAGLQLAQAALLPRAAGYKGGGAGARRGGSMGLPRHPRAGE